MSPARCSRRGPNRDADCPLCPRLVAFRETWRSREPSWFNAPVPSFGPADARLLIAGLAPGLKGANRTGRPFTGDYAGDLLYETMLAYGFAAGVYDERPDDGMTLVDARISNSVRCVPPDNKPIGSEIATCRPFLVATIADMPRLADHPGPRPHRSRQHRRHARRAPGPQAVRPRGAPRHRRRGALRQLSLLPIQYEHRAADAGDVPGRLRRNPRRTRSGIMRR